MSGGGGGGSSSSGPPAWVVPYMENFLQRSQQVSKIPYQAYTGQTVAQLNPYQTSALDYTAARAMNGSPVNDAASNELQSTLGGAYLSQGNPYMDALVGRAQGDVIRGYQQSVVPQLDMLAARSGSFGNTGVQQATTDAQHQLLNQLGDISTSLRGGAYENERNRMQSAVSQAPSIAAQDYVDANALLGAGGALQTQQQRNLDDSYQRFLEQRDYPVKQLQILGQGLGANYGTTTTQNIKGSPIAGGMGGALAGAQLGSIVPGIGTGIGAVVGGGLGALGGK